MLLRPKPHQLEAIPHFKNNLLLADPCGMGKTLTTVLAIKEYYTGRKPILIIAPRNIKQWWADQLAEHLELPSFISLSKAETAASYSSVPEVVSTESFGA